MDAVSSSRSARSPASRANSTRKNGLPSVRSRSCSASASETGFSLTRASSSTTAGVGSPDSSSRTACFRAIVSATSASTPVGSGCARQVARTIRCSPAVASAVSASSRSTRRVEGSAQCRSSSTTRVVCSRDASRITRVMRSQARNCAPSSSSASSPPSSAPIAPSTARHGHRGGAPSSWEQRPTRTRTPRSRARSAISAARRVLPMPGSPVSTAYDGLPATAPASACSSAPRSCSRPASAQGATASGSGRAGAGAATGAAGGAAGTAPGSGATQSSARSCRSTAVWRSRSSAEGSRPSSSSSTSRSRRSTSRASA